ncbi:DUF4232 domain-containing protein [Kitasatospora sp. NPDC004240]
MNDRRRPGPATVGAALLAVSLLVTGATGCSGGKSKKGRGSSSKHDGPDSNVGSNGGATFSPGTTSTSSASAAANGRCRAADLGATVQIQQTGSAMVILTNKGRTDCTVTGYPGLGGRLADNRDARTPVKREPHPGPPARFTLKPGTSGYAGLKWASCAKSDASCAVLTTVQLTPPDETSPLTAQLLGTDGKPVAQLPVSAAGFTAGSFQPSNQGVLFPTS